jgi:putative colanic acid biosynthesis glycosyltransferase
MKILQINSVCGIGSTGRIAADIHNILIERGHESYIAYGREIPKNCSSNIKIGSKLDNYAHVMKTRILDKHGFGSKKATKEFIKKIKELNPDVVHLHNIHGYYINVEVLFDYLKEANKPVIWTLHDCWSFTGHCAYFDYVGCDKWRTKCHTCPEKNAYPSSLILDCSKNNYLSKRKIFTGVKHLTIVTPSKWLANLVKQSFLQAYPVEVINNGIDLETFKPVKGIFREKYRLNDRYIILGVANIWDRRKGLKYFIDLSYRLKDDELIVLVGLTEKQISELPRNIIGITRTNDIEELVDIYSSADVYVNLTLEDNFPTTNIEALACGTPVITFDTGGSPEIIDQSCGFTIEKRNIDQFVERIKEMRFGNKTNYSKMARTRAERLYNKNDKFAQYIEKYNQYIEFQ